jgi:NitT/TauT family transport system substrate-binding protein
MKMSRRQAVEFGVAACGAALLGGRAQAEADRLRIAFALNRGPYDASNAPFLLAERKGYFLDANIDIAFSLSKDAQDVLHRVASNDYDFGFLDLSVLLRFALEKPESAPLYVFAIFDRSPASVVTWKTSGVIKPSDLAGKTLAAVETDGAFQLFPVFLRAAGVDPASVKLKMTALAEREQIMARHEADGAIGFDSTIFYKLAAGGATLADVDITYYANGGLDLYSNGIIVSRKMLASHPERIASIVTACAKGWRDALAAPQDAVNVLAEVAPTIDQTRELARFDWIKTRQILTPDVRRDGLGLVDPARLARTIAQIEALDGKGGLRVEQIYSKAYLPAKEDRSIG